MKIRMGFVSNSSTSSFCIYGVDLTYEELFGKPFDDHFDAEAVVEKMGLEFHLDYESEEGLCAVGLSWPKIKNNETALQFKQRVKALVRKLLKSTKSKAKVTFGTIEDTFQC